MVTYCFALKYYNLCNAIDTTPILEVDKSLEVEAVGINEEHSERLLGLFKPQRYSCGICKIACEYRTRHCRKCNVCIERYDHHCFWIGNCVGRHNHKQFYLFLAVQTVNNIVVFLLISRLKTSANWQWWLQLAGKLFSLGFCCFTGYLLLYHTMLVSCGITTWEHMRRIRISYLKYLPAGFNPFSKGIVHNWKHFFME
jgi:palmitoyltransferase